MIARIAAPCAVLALSCADLALTLRLLGAGLAYEANPVCAWLLAISPSLLGAVKVAVTGLGCALLAVWWRHRSARVGTFLLLAVFYGLVMYEVGLAAAW